jgi:hypothetical protein
LPRWIEWVKNLLIHKQGGGKYTMRIDEIIIKPIKPKPPMTLPQARINGLKQGVQRSKQQLKQEQERQRQQRENERRQKQLRQR